MRDSARSTSSDRQSRSRRGHRPRRHAAWTSRSTCRGPADRGTARPVSGRWRAREAAGQRDAAVIIPLLVLVQAVAPGWTHPAYPETALYIGLALLGFQTRYHDHPDAKINETTTVGTAIG
jgi:hypothetical protein